MPSNLPRGRPLAREERRKIAAGRIRLPAAIESSRPWFETGAIGRTAACVRPVQAAPASAPHLLIHATIADSLRITFCKAGMGPAVPGSILRHMVESIVT